MQKIAIVTGANTGLGYQTSLELAKKGFTVVMACRSRAKAQAAIDTIKAEISNADVFFIQLDLVDRDSIQQFAASFSATYDHINVLVNNAGVMGPPHTITQNGLELQFDANHMGHFYLTSLLMKQLTQDFETRIVNVSSLAGKYEEADIHFDNINFEGNYESGRDLIGLKGMAAYSQSKLANILFTMELKRRIAKAGKNIKAVVAHPGASNTDLSRHASPLIRLVIPVLTFVMPNVSTPEEGAESLIYAALSKSVEAGDFIGPTGKDERVGAAGKVPLPAQASDEELAAKLWQFSEEHLKISFSI